MIGQNLGPYEVLELLGQGGMGEVYRARDAKLERDVAIKVLSQGQTLDPEAKSRFLREARTASALDHPNICSIYQVDETDDGQLYIVMAYYRGQTLRERIAVGPPAIEEALRIGGQVASGLARAHAAGIVHRDLKPANVILTDEGLAKILDFGLAKMAGEATITRSGTSLGTPSYMSPEQVAAKPLDARSDIWSLCVLLHELLTGTSPFTRPQLASTLSAILHDEPRPLRELAPGVPEGIADFVMAGLSKDPDARPESLNPLLEMLGLPVAGAPAVSFASITDQTIDMGAPTTRLDRDRPRDSRRVSRLLILALLVMVPAGVYWWTQLNSAPPLLRVAVVAPEISGTTDEALAEITAMNLQGAIIRALDARVAIAVTEIGASDAETATIAREHAVDEVVRSKAVFSGSDWQVQLRRLDPADQVLWSASFSVSDERDLDFASVVTAWCGQGYEDRATRPGATDAQVTPKDYSLYLQSSRRYHVDQSLDGIEAVLATLDQIEASSPRFLDALLLDANVALYGYASTREAAFAQRSRDRIARATQLAPDDPRVAREGIWLALELSDFDEAQRLGDKLERLHPGTPELASVRAQIAQAEGEFDVALDHMERAVLRQPSASNLKTLSELQYQQNQFDGAIATLKRLLEIQPGSSYGRAKLAEIELLHGSAVRATELYTAIIEGGGDATEYSNLGLAQQLTGDFEAAEASFHAAERDAPGHPYILLNLADCLAAQGRMDEAQTYYVRVAQDFESQEELDWADRLVLAQCQAQLGEQTKAVENTQRALQAGADEAEAYFMASLVYCLTGSRVPALVNAREALKRGYNHRWFALPWFDPIRDDPDFARLTAPNP